MLSAPDFAYKQVVVAFMCEGEKFACNNDNLIISDKKGHTLHQSSFYRLFALFVVGNITVTSPLLLKAKKFGFSLFFMTQNLKSYGTWNAVAEGNVVLRKKQYQYIGLDIAQHLVANKIEQQIDNLKKVRSKTDSFKLAIGNLWKYRQRLEEEYGKFGELSKFWGLEEQKVKLQELLGLEGIASRVYFEQMFLEQDWKGRKPRLKHDITNYLLDLGYTVLFNLIDALLNLYGFDVYKGVYHQEFYQRKSLVCDLVEPFRPLIDYQVRKAWQLKQIDVEDFTFNNGQYNLSWNKNKKYSQIFVKNLMEHKHYMFLYVQKYYRAFIREKPISEYPIWQK